MGLIRNLRALVRLVRLRSVETAEFEASHAAAAALVVAKVALAAGAGWILTDGPRAFLFGGFARESLWVVLALGLAWLAAREVARPALLLPLFVALMGVGLACSLLQAAVLGVEQLTGVESGSRASGALWLLTIALSMRVVALFTGLGVLRSASLVGVWAAAAIYASLHLHGREFWYTVPSDEPEHEHASIDAEALLHGQAARVASALEGLAAERPGVPDLYFLGFAADATQAVFRREVEFARSLFDDRFGTAGRSLVLENDEETAEERPLASASNLHDALVGLAQVMNPDEDVLFLFLDGHGAREGRLAVRFPPLPLDDLTPQRLADELDEAGIRWRVIVVSACYSGTFVEPLRGDDSLVITAAAADRTSFGCSDKARFTEFGRAFFAEALESKHAFPAAFEAARARIAERERAASRTPSLPQIAAGPAILEKLARLDARIARRFAATAPRTPSHAAQLADRALPKGR
jgi:hypothetical protein